VRGVVPGGAAVPSTGNQELNRQPAVQRVPAPAASAQAASAAQDITAVRDLGDVIEVPVVEEQLVRMPVVKEIIRIRKTRQTVRQVVDADLRKEDVIVEQSGDVQAHDAQVHGTQVLPEEKSQ
ncbi:MAG: DUF2382 domain-containing protein, partial [Chloroflexi bacterium]|nr:DUF2382 domain-containing protein [Chloroflexota bacterium]